MLEKTVQCANRLMYKIKSNRKRNWKNEKSSYLNTYVYTVHCLQIIQKNIFKNECFDQKNVE